MSFLRKVVMLYVHGFKHLSLGKVLWKIIIIKLLIIFVGLKMIIYDKNLSHIGDFEDKSAFVLKNLMQGGMYGDSK